MMALRDYGPGLCAGNKTKPPAKVSLNRNAEQILQDGSGRTKAMSVENTVENSDIKNHAHIRTHTHTSGIIQTNMYQNRPITEGPMFDNATARNVDVSTHPRRQDKKSTQTKSCRGGVRNTSM